MTDRIQLTVDYTFMTLDGQPQVLLAGSIVDVPSAKDFPSAVVITKGVSTTVPAGSHGASGGKVRTR